MKHILCVLLVICNSLIVIRAMADQSADLVRRVEAALPRHPGACVLVIDGGKIVFQHGFGLADVEAKTSCTPTTNFRIASVSKQFTATAVLLLADRGKLKLDDTLDHFFPGFPEYGKQITVKHLLTHTSGLPAYENLIPAGTTLQLDDADVLHMLMDTTEPRFPPDEKFEYSNSAFVLLGLIVEIVAEKPFQQFMAEEIFRPLGMDHSLVYQRGFNEVPQRAYGHEWKDGHWARADQSVTSATRGDGSIYTSLEDYQKWLKGIDDQKLLTPASYKAMFTPQVESDRSGSRYGYGWFLDEYRGEPRIHHNGDTRGFALCVQRFPKRDAAVFIQLNGAVDETVTTMTAVGERVADLVIFERGR